MPGPAGPKNPLKIRVFQRFTITYVHANVIHPTATNVNGNGNLLGATVHQIARKIVSKIAKIICQRNLSASHDS
jgi:hypothetical protein